MSFTKMQKWSYSLAGLDDLAYMFLEGVTRIKKNTQVFDSRFHINL